MVLPWSGSAACYDHCKYGSTVPGGYTICTCSFVFEYKSNPPPPHPCPSSPLVPPLLPSLVLLSSLSPPSSISPFFCKRGVKKTGVFELSVQYVSSLSPCSPCPLDCPRWVCFVQEVGTIDVSLYVPVEHLWLLSLAAVNKHVLVEDSETLSFLISLFSFYRLSILYVGVQKSFKSKHFYLYSSLSL